MPQLIHMKNFWWKVVSVTRFGFRAVPWGPSARGVYLHELPDRYEVRSVPRPRGKNRKA
jgi:hypothetical protein